MATNSADSNAYSAAPDLGTGLAPGGGDASTDLLASPEHLPSDARPADQSNISADVTYRDEVWQTEADAVVTPSEVSVDVVAAGVDVLDEDPNIADLVEARSVSGTTGVTAERRSVPTIEPASQGIDR